MYGKTILSPTVFENIIEINFFEIIIEINFFENIIEINLPSHVLFKRNLDRIKIEIYSM